MKRVSDPLLEVKELGLQIFTPHGVIPCLRNISFSIKEKEILFVLGESGCGKSMLAMSLLQLLPRNIRHTLQGQVLFKGKDILSLPEDELYQVRGKYIGFVFQNFMTALHPMIPVGKQIAEGMRFHLGLSQQEAHLRAIYWMERVGILHAQRRAQQYPYEFSGGQCQRIAIAIALASNPSILIVDEPTTALDVTVQAQILQLLQGLREELGMSILFITHDLGVVSALADRVLVIYAGKIVEKGSVFDLFQKPRHPYTKGLFQALPGRMDMDNDQPSHVIPGAPPDFSKLPFGCAFHPRCAFAMKVCALECPEQSVVEQQNCACHLYCREAKSMRDKFEKQT